jgi:hypothetical protein
MPYKSEAQRRWMHAAESRGEVPKGTASHWEHTTPKNKKLPEHVKKTAAVLASEILHKTGREISTNKTKKTAAEIADSIMHKCAADPIPISETIAKLVANNTDDVLMAIMRRKQQQRSKTAGSKIIPDELARNYFFANPYGLDFSSWAGMQDTPEDNIDVPSESMSSEEEAPYDSETEAGYQPTAPDESTEPMTSPANPVPLPANRRKDAPMPAGKPPKVAALLQVVAVDALARHGLLKLSNGDESGKPVVRKKVEEFLQRNASPEDEDFHAFAQRRGYNPHAAEEVAYNIAHKCAKEYIPGGRAEGKPVSKYDPDEVAKGQEIEKEHSPDLGTRTEISKDHLEEFEFYNTALLEMERRLKLRGDTLEGTKSIFGKMPKAASAQFDGQLAAFSRLGISMPKSASVSKLALNPNTIKRVVDKAIQQKGIPEVVRRAPRALNKAITSTLGSPTSISTAAKNTTPYRSVTYNPESLDNFEHLISRTKGRDNRKSLRNSVLKNFGVPVVSGGLIGLSLGSRLGSSKRTKKAEDSSFQGRLSALSKLGLDAAELLGQDEQRKDDLHQQLLRHNEETHKFELAKTQLELQQKQETFAMKQQQQAQKDQEAQQQAMMEQQMQQQQQQQMSQQWMSNMAGQSGQNPQTQGVQQPPQQGHQGPPQR